MDVGVEFGRSAENRRHYSTDRQDAVPVRVKRPALNKKGSEIIEANQDERVLTPKKSIKNYCLYECEKKGRRYSKRDVAMCTHYRCPLYPYRSGVLRKKVQVYGKTLKNQRLQYLQSARDAVKRAEEKYEEEWKKTEELKIEREVKAKEKRKSLEAKADLIIREYRKQTNEMMKKREKYLTRAIDYVNEKKRRVKELEELYDRELELGMWGDPEELYNEEQECEECSERT